MVLDIVTVNDHMVVLIIEAKRGDVGLVMKQILLSMKDTI